MKINNKFQKLTAYFWDFFIATLIVIVVFRPPLSTKFSTEIHISEVVGHTHSWTNKLTVSLSNTKFKQTICVTLASLNVCARLCVYAFVKNIWSSPYSWFFFIRIEWIAGWLVIIIEAFVCYCCCYFWPKYLALVLLRRFSTFRSILYIQIRNNSQPNIKTNEKKRIFFLFSRKVKQKPNTHEVEVVAAPDI